MISGQEKYVCKEREGCRLDQTDRQGELTQLRAKQRAEVEEERKRKRSEEEVCDYVSK